MRGNRAFLFSRWNPSQLCGVYEDEIKRRLCAKTVCLFWYLSSHVVIDWLRFYSYISACRILKPRKQAYSARLQLNQPRSNTDSNNAYLNCLSPALQMNVERAAHTATLLPDGRVLIAGGFREEGTSEIAISSAEIFDPETNTFTPTSDMNAPRNGHTATLLPNGQVLIAGGWDQSGRTSTAELYDPQTGTFEYTGSMMAPRQGLTATLLKNGQVLIAGGDSARNTPQLTAELYDPATETFTPTGNLKDGRIGHTSTLLTDGTVLLVGGTSR